MQKVYFSAKPEEIKYMKKPSGLADVWLRGNIQELALENDDGETFQQWQADETFISNTKLTEAEVKADFFNLFVNAANVQAELTKAVQDYMDKTVQARNYDSIHTACTYANSTDEKFSAEGKACVVWRDQVWRTCYNILDSILNGSRSNIPTAAELIAELPKLEW